jgi:hypothetical protein
VSNAPSQTHGVSRAAHDHARSVNGMTVADGATSILPGQKLTTSLIIPVEMPRSWRARGQATRCSSSQRSRLGLADRRQIGATNAPFPVKA